MPETVFVTLLWNGQEADMELPARVPLKGFAEPLKQALCLCFPGFSPGGRQLRLKTRDGFLSGDGTLEDYSVFDGEILELELTV